MPAAATVVPNGHCVQPEQATLRNVPPGLVAPCTADCACRCRHCRSLFATVTIAPATARCNRCRGRSTRRLHRGAPIPTPPSQRPDFRQCYHPSDWLLCGGPPGSAVPCTYECVHTGVSTAVVVHASAAGRTGCLRPSGCVTAAASRRPRRPQRCFGIPTGAAGRENGGGPRRLLAPQGRSGRRGGGSAAAGSRCTAARKGEGESFRLTVGPLCWLAHCRWAGVKPRQAAVGAAE